MKRKSKKTEEEMNLSNKEKEILDSYNDNYTEIPNQKYKSKKKKEEPFEMEEFEFNEEEKEEDYEDFEFVEDEPKKKKKAKKEKKPKKEKLEEFELVEDILQEDDKKQKKMLTPEEKKINKKINIVIIILFVAISLIAIDITAVVKFNSGPFFALPLKKYNNKETTAYYGLGYKVIKYNETKGRHGTEIGYWTLKYNNKPIETHVIDLAIDFNNDEQLSYNRYNNVFLKVTGTLDKVSEKQNTITIVYVDTEGGKYSLTINCKLNDKDELEKVSTHKEVTVIGTMTKYKYKTESNPGTITLSDCYVVD